MRSEHRTTGDEWDLLYWKPVLSRFSRSKAAKEIKARGHRYDRRIAKPRDIRSRLDD